MYLGSWNLSSWFTVSNAFYLLSGIFLSLAFLSRAMLWLRILTGVSAVMGIIYAALIGENLMIVGQIGLVVINLVQIVLLILDSRPMKLPKELEDLYHRVFHHLTSNEFLDFVALGERREINQSFLCHEGDQINQLYCILQGTVSVIKHEQHIDELKRGAFVGEMSFLTGQACSADAHVDEKAECIVWDFDTLHKLEEENPNLYIQFLSTLGIDVVRKLQYRSSLVAMELSEDR